MKMKKCIKCGEVKPLTDEYWHKRKASKDGFRNDCRVCYKKYHAKYHRDNKERRAEYDAKWRRDNKERSAEYHAKYRRDNKERRAEYYAKYRRDQLPDSYVKLILRGCGYTDSKITQEMIEERRNQILAKRLGVPLGTDFSEAPENAVPEWLGE